VLINQTQMSSSSLTKHDRVSGMLFGLAIGDALGIPHEFSRISPKLAYTGIINDKHQLQVRWQWSSTIIPPASTSDDTAMTLSLFEELAENKFEYNQERVALAYMKFANSHKLGLGKNTRRLFHGVKTYKGYQKRYNKLLKKIQECQSNGSLMRASPLIFSNDKTTDHCLSNPNEVNADCNRIYLKLLEGIYANKDKETLKKELKEEKVTSQVQEAITSSFTTTKDKRWNMDGKEKGWVINTLYISLASFWLFDSYQDAMDWIVQIPQSDTDTNAAVAGALFGAYLGFSSLEKESKTCKNIEIIRDQNQEGKRIINLLTKLKTML